MSRPAARKQPAGPGYADPGMALPAERLRARAGRRVAQPAGEMTARA